MSDVDESSVDNDSQAAENTAQDGAEAQSGETDSTDRSKTDEGKDAQDRAADPEQAKQWRSFTTDVDDALDALVGVRTANLFLGPTSIASVGDQYHAVTSSPLGMVLRSGPVPRLVLDHIKQSYVEPARYHDVRTRLDNEHFMVLRAPAGTGRTTTALHMLDHLCRAGVRKLDPDAKLKALSAKDLTENNGYLLEWLDPEQAKDLRAFHAERLAQLMNDSGCRLVVIVDEATPLRREELGERVVDDLGAVEPASMLRRHVRAALRRTGGVAGNADILDRTEVRQIVDGISADLSRRELAVLAAMLVDVVHGHLDLAQVRARYTEATEEDFVSWFEKEISIDQRAFTIALAVFNNEPVQVVSAAAKLLAERIMAVEVPRRVDRARKVFATSLQERLRDARAELVEDTQDTGFGSVAVKRVRFRDQRYPARILERVYSEYDQAFDVVREWLLRLGSIPGSVARVRAGMAAGLLSLRDFTGIYHGLVCRWADSGDPDEQRAAIAALQIPSRDPAHARVVFRLLETWSKQPGRSARRVTALRALGSTAAMSPTAALRLLRYAARRADWSMAYVIGESITELHNRVDDRGQVLRELAKWSEDEEFPLRRRTALLATLILSNYVSVDVPTSSELWPVVLWAADRDKEHRVLLVRLFGQLLVAADFMQRGYDEMYRWAKSAQKDPTLRKPLADFLFDVGDAADELESIRHELRYRAQQRGGPRDAVRDVLAHIDRRDG